MKDIQNPKKEQERSEEMIPEFTENDIFVMLQTLNTKSIIGFSNPFIKLTKQEIEKEWEKTYKKLHLRGLINLVDGEVKIEEGFVNALWIMSRTNLTVEMLTDGKKKNVFYFGTENVVECSRTADNNYTLYMHGAPDDTWNDVIYPRMLAGVEKQHVQMKDSILIPTSMYNKCIEKGLVLDTAKLEPFNASQNLNSITKKLNHSIKNKIHNSRLMLFYKEDSKWSIEGLHILTSPTGNWTFKMINENEVELLEAKNSTSIEIVAEILDVMRRVRRR